MINKVSGQLTHTARSVVETVKIIAMFLLVVFVYLNAWNSFVAIAVNVMFRVN